MFRRSAVRTALSLVIGSLGVSHVAVSQTDPTAASASAAASAAPTPAPAATAAPASTAGSASRRSPPLPPPTDAQQRAYEQLRREATEYTTRGRAFKGTLTKIVRHYYEERRRRVLAALDKEIDGEKKSLEEARKTAIIRLEEFVARYSGTNADPVATPDAMFRLAALYEERARDGTGELGDGLKPAIALYRRIVVEFPKYEEIAAVHYYLGHAYTDAGRIEEGQQAWRALVCSDHYSVKADATSTDKIEMQPLPQDHDDKFWNNWYNQNPVPLDQANKGRTKDKAPKAAVGKKGQILGAESLELSYVSPYDGCHAIAQNTDAGEEPRYIAEIWWQIGNYHFDQIDPKGGPYNLNRAVTAYESALAFKKEPIFGVSMYKQAWTYFKQQRYRTSVEWFVKLLHHTDEIEEKTGDPGADFRTEAYTYIAGSLTYVDMDGPPPADPYIPRNDVLDSEPDPVVAERKMAIAIERVQDPALVPQDKKWTVEIYKSLAQEFIEITQNHNAIAMLELTLKKFPLNRDAPVMQNKVAELYDQLSRLAPDGSAARAEYAAKALEARTRLEAYVGAGKPWVDANRDDTEALQQAELLVRNGLKRAAADHTNYARAFVDKAKETSDPGESKRWIEKAIEEYRLAETGWNAYLQQDQQATDSYESRFWLADSRFWAVVLQLQIDKMPRQEEITGAREASVSVRDSNEDDKFQTNAGYYVVVLAERILDYEYKRYESSGGKEGIEKRDSVKFDSEDVATRKVVVEAVPPRVMDTITARDDYTARIPPDRDPYKNGELYAYQAGEYLFVYGQFAEAKKRFEPLVDQYCGKDKYGYQAFRHLFDIAIFTGDKAAQGALLDKDCSYDKATHEEWAAVQKGGNIARSYETAAAAFKAAEALPDGAEKNKKWAEAAGLYEAALKLDPANDGASEAVINGAYAYQQIGEFDKAIELYEMFIAKYGSEKILVGLRDGDPKAKPPVPANKEKYAKRVDYLKRSYDALAGAYVLFFSYPKAAETYEKISTISHFDQAARRGSAKSALGLYASIGDTGGMDRARDRFRDLGASPQELAEADFTIASADVKKWDELSPDTGANQAARRKVEVTMTAYFDANKKKDGAAKFVVAAAWWVAKAKKAGGSGDADKWWQATITAWESWKRLAPKASDGTNSAVGSREADMAAQAEFTLIDEELQKKFDYDSGFHRYKGESVKVVADYRADAAVGKKYFDRLQRVIDTYASRQWTVATLVRQGTVFDSLRTGLYNTRPPALKMFTAKQEAALKKAEESDDPDLQSKADEIRVSVTKAWREARDRELDSADQIVVDRYANAYLIAQKYGVSSPQVTHALRRLAFLTDVIGEAKMKQFAGAVKELSYTEGMFSRKRPGQVAAPKGNGLPSPLPAAVQ